MQYVQTLVFLIFGVLSYITCAAGIESAPGGISPESGCAILAASTALKLAPDAENEDIASAVKPNVLLREDWNAKNPISKMKTHKPRCLTIHHTATPQNAKAPLAQKMRNLQHFSQNRAQLGAGKFKPAWADVPYHFYIDVKGEIAEGRKTKYVGDSNTPYNPTGHIQIVLEGNFEQEEPSANQLESLLQLTVWLSLVWEIDPALLKGHKDYVATACPGKNLEKTLPKLRQQTAERLATAKTGRQGTTKSKYSR